MVVDALEECEENDAEIILSLLAQEDPLPRVFIAARPEPHIRFIYERDRNHDQLHLYNIVQR